MIRLLVTGGRDYDDRAFLFDTLDALHGDGPISVVIHGGATGADELAKQWARSRGIEHDPHPAAWDDIDAPGAVIRINRRGKPYNVMAGFQRNAEMLRRCCPTHVAIFDGGNGTKDMADRAYTARNRGRQIEILDYRRDAAPSAFRPRYGRLARMSNTPSPAVRYLPVTPTSEQREIGRASDLYQHGDMILAWVNEGDLGEVNLPPLPTAIEEAAARMDAVEALPDIIAELRRADR